MKKATKDTIKKDIEKIIVVGSCMGLCIFCLASGHNEASGEFAVGAMIRALL